MITHIHTHSIYKASRNVLTSIYHSEEHVDRRNDEVVAFFPEFSLWGMDIYFVSTEGQSFPSVWAGSVVVLWEELIEMLDE